MPYRRLLPTVIPLGSGCRLQQNDCRHLRSLQASVVRVPTQPYAPLSSGRAWLAPGGSGRRARTPKENWASERATAGRGLSHLVFHIGVDNLSFAHTALQLLTSALERPSPVPENSAPAPPLGRRAPRGETGPLDAQPLP
eukprot:scaffold37420_cov62-Phaeocystis_antarctica.AAC.5